MNCQIKMNTMNGLLGVSGSGKSTLLKAFLSKVPDKLPDKFSGQIFLANSSLQMNEKLKPKPLYLAFVGQQDLFHESEFLLKGLKKHYLND